MENNSNVERAARRRRRRAMLASIVGRSPKKGLKRNRIRGSGRRPRCYQSNAGSYGWERDAEANGGGR
eukprot:6080502-Pleurochrysis_carterae.AAC.1